MNMTNEEVISKTESFVQQTLVNAEGGHDWWHIERVRRLAKKIANAEKANPFVVELGALLHDIADAKFNNGDEAIGPAMAAAFLTSLKVEESIITHVVNIIQHISFKTGNTKHIFTSIELDIVQDADRLDALGAIGIARAFNYGGFKNRQLYHPGILPNVSQTISEYKKSNSPTINHFYEKLFLLKNLMNTQTARHLATQKHAFMETFVLQFMAEWNDG
jgi:uncharacterized protein